MDPVRYKGFYIVVTVERETETKFQVIGQIYQNLEEKPVMRDWLPVQEFATEQAAYEFGLKEACAWIDEEQ